MDLAGTWQAIEADETLRRSYPEPDFDDTGWAGIDVPGHWRSSDAFADSDGPLLYRHRFEAPAPEGTHRAWLTFDGLFYQSDVWLDGSYLGDTEGYFFPHTFEVTDALRERAEHVLALELTCAPQSDPEWNPGGIWRPVHITSSGPVRIARLRTLCAEATPDRAVVRFRALLDASDAGNVRIRTTVGGTDHESEQPLSAGENRVNWTVVVDQPALWWPHALGDQPLCDVAVEISVGGEASDRRAFRTGLRQVRMKNWICSVNGERLFLKGSNQGPTRLRLAEATADEMERDVVLAKDAGLDLLRIHGHVGRPELYDAADRHGLLLWQDFPLHGGYARGIRKQAVRQAREAVDVLGHHPSVAIWCACGATVKRALEKSDTTRPVVARSGALPRVGRRDLPALLAVWPRLARFVNGFGAPAVPETADFMEPERWPDLDWEQLGPSDMFGDGLDPVDFPTFAEWQRATQAYQAELVRHHVEHLRRLKYRPTGGFCQFSFADGHPAVTWSVLDHERVPKPGYEALAAACAPVIVTADRPAATYAPGDAVALDVHVVSDLRTAVEGARVSAVLRWTGGSASWSWQGDVAADACVRVGMVRAMVPDAPGPLVLELDLDADDVKGANRYESVIVRP